VSNFYSKYLGRAAQAQRSAAARLSQKMSNLSSCVPKNKSDLEAAQSAVDVGYPGVEPILPELLEWLQDYNWPVAHVLAPFLASIGEPLVPHVNRILETDDKVWKYWMIVSIMKESAVIASSCRTYLQRLVKEPTEAEAREELDQVAQEVLEQYGWAV